KNWAVKVRGSVGREKSRMVSPISQRARCGRRDAIADCIDAASMRWFNFLTDDFPTRCFPIVTRVAKMLRPRRGGRQFRPGTFLTSAGSQARVLEGGRVARERARRRC